MGARILLTGANGYIGLRLLPELLVAGHDVDAVVRDAGRLPVSDFAELLGTLRIIEADFLEDSPSFPAP